MPRGICAEAGCPDPPTYRGRCQRHARERDKQINRAGHDIYRTRKWHYTRRKKLALNPICETEGCDELAEHVHHIEDIADGGAPYAMENLASLCAVHHGRITRAAQLANVKRPGTATTARGMTPKE